MTGFFVWIRGSSNNWNFEKIAEKWQKPYLILSKYGLWEMRKRRGTEGKKCAMKNSHLDGDRRKNMTEKWYNKMWQNGNLTIHKMLIFIIIIVHSLQLNGRKDNVYYRMLDGIYIRMNIKSSQKISSYFCFV